MSGSSDKNRPPRRVIAGMEVVRQVRVSAAHHRRVTGLRGELQRAAVCDAAEAEGFEGWGGEHLAGAVGNRARRAEVVEGIVAGPGGGAEVREESVAAPDLVLRPVEHACAGRAVVAPCA